MGNQVNNQFSQSGRNQFSGKNFNQFNQGVNNGLYNNFNGNNQSPVSRYSQNHQSRPLSSKTRKISSIPVSATVGSTRTNDLATAELMSVSFWLKKSCFTSCLYSNS